MSIKISINRNDGYLSYTAPSRVDVKRVKARRNRLDTILRTQGLERILYDLRAVDLSHYKVIDADILALPFESDLPSCKKIAVVCRPSEAMAHFRNLCLCRLSIELGFFGEFKAAGAWLASGKDQR